MKTLKFPAILASMLLASNSVVAQDSDVEAAKQAAKETCLNAAIQRYDSAEVVSRPKMKKLGGIRGYGYQLRVGKKSRKVVCVASADGEVKFFNGSL